MLPAQNRPCGSQLPSFILLLTQPRSSGRSSHSTPPDPSSRAMPVPAAAIQLSGWPSTGATAPSEDTELCDQADRGPRLDCCLKQTTAEDVDEYQPVAD